MNQRLERIDEMAAFLREPVREFIAAVQKDTGYQLFVVFTWRSSAKQSALYQQGREFKREDGIWVVVNRDAVVTDAPAGQSPHNVVTKEGAPASVAIDTVPIVAGGQLLWGLSREMWKPIWAIAWKFGLDPLGDSIGSYYQKDLCHFEEPAWQHKLDGLGLVRPTGVIHART